MFILKDFVYSTIVKMIGKLPDYRVSEYALSWYTRGTIGEEDLAKIEKLITDQYPPVIEEEV